MSSVKSGHGKRPISPEPPSGDTILVVAKRTGFSMDTLRVWERRYGFPRPERRAGSNRRLYSQADVDKLLAIRRALDQGYRVGDVIGKSLPELESLAGEAAPLVPTAEPWPLVTSEGLVALLARDRIAELEEALRLAGTSLGPRRFVTEVAHPFAVSVGLAWAEGRISVRHEHVATECLVTRLRVLLAGFQDVEGRPRVLLATLPGEPHGLALQMVALYLVAAGAKPRLLGVSTPPDEILAAARDMQVDVVGLSFTPVVDMHQAWRSVKVLRRRLPAQIALWLGGSGASEIGRIDGDVHVAATWSELDEALEGWRRAHGLERKKP